MAELPQGVPLPPSAFLTGSHVYGTPRAGSDIDVVVFLTGEELARLRAMAQAISPDDAETVGSVAADQASTCIRIGRIDFIVCTTLERYENWRIGTEHLARLRPVTRYHAVQVFKGLFLGDGDPFGKEPGGSL